MKAKQVFKNILPTCQPKSIINSFKHFSQLIHISFATSYIVIFIQRIIYVYPYLSILLFLIHKAMRVEVNCIDKEVPSIQTFESFSTNQYHQKDSIGFQTILCRVVQIEAAKQFMKCKEDRLNKSIMSHPILNITNIFLSIVFLLEYGYIDLSKM